MLHGLPRPLPDLDTETFWSGCEESRFLIPVCASCDISRWPPGPVCPRCGATVTRFRDAPRAGRVYSWTVVTHSVHPATHDQVPYCVALVELEPGIRVVGNVWGCAPDDIVAGLEVELFFEDHGDARLPNFRVR
jgi:uncharacterized OB-fold protein